MQEIETYLQTQVTPWATIGLFSAAGKEPFYAQYGYQNRTGSPLGLGTCRFI